MRESIDARSIPAWPSCYRDAVDIAGRLGPPGIQSGLGFVAWRGQRGHIHGILTLDQHMGFLVHVDPDHRRRGIATRLLDEALRRWDLDLAGERYTPAGAAWIATYHA